MCCPTSAADRSGPAPPGAGSSADAARGASRGTGRDLLSPHPAGEVVAERDLAVYQHIGQAKARETHL